MKKLNDEVSTRFKIMYALMQATKPLKITEIARQTGLVEPHVFYHLPKLIKDCLIIEAPEGYSCQPFLLDTGIKEDLNNLMKVIVKVILREIHLPDGSTKKDLERAMMRNLEIYIQSFAVDNLG